MITTPNTDSFSRKIMGSKWHHYNSEHLFYFNLQSIKKICSIVGFEIIHYSSLIKIMRLDYICNQLNRSSNNISKLISLFRYVPIIGKMRFPILTGDFIVILKIL